MSTVSGSCSCTSAGGRPTVPFGRNLGDVGFEEAEMDVELELRRVGR